MTSARDFCEASPRLLQRLLASASRCSRKTSTSSNFQRPGGHPAVTTSRNRPAGSFHPRWPPLDPARRTVDEQRQHACVRLRSACMGNVCCRLRLAHTAYMYIGTSTCACVRAAYRRSIGTAPFSRYSRWKIKSER